MKFNKNELRDKKTKRQKKRKDRKAERGIDRKRLVKMNDIINGDLIATIQQDLF